MRHPLPRLSSTVLFFVTLIFGGLLVYFTTQIDFGEQQFVLLAKSFWHGSLAFIETPAQLMDAVPFQGKYYWPLGPFPAALLFPLVPIFETLHIPLTQGYLNAPLVILIGVLIFLIARRLGYQKQDAGYWSISFCCASAMLGVALLPFSWYYAHIVTIALVFATFLEYCSKRRPAVMGLYLACAFLTRATAGLSALFFLAELLSAQKPMKKRLVDCVKMGVPLFGGLILFMVYNFFRFGSFFEQGYGMQTLIEPLTRARDYGMFHIAHIPGNLYYALLAVPVPVFRDSISRVLTFPFLRPDAWGMSIFVTSPYLLRLFFFRYVSWTSLRLLGVSLCIALVVASYYGIGYRQFGYRYALDFLPLLTFLLMTEYSRKAPRLSTGMKALIVISALFNLFLFVGFLYVR